MTMSRTRLPVTRPAVTRKFAVPTPLVPALPCGKCGAVADQAPAEKMKFYLTVGAYEDGRPGEIFLRADKVGSLASGAFDAVAMCVSVGLQYGIPLEAFTSKLKGMQFEPRGFTGDPEFPSCSSVLDLVARFLEKRYAAKEPTS